jgi:ABC-type uncharacterized transport system permease subunit
MNGEVQRMFRGAIGGAALGGGLGGAVFGAMSAILVGLEPVVFVVCGIYAGTVYGGIVGALRAREDWVEFAPVLGRSRP